MNLNVKTTIASFSLVLLVMFGTVTPSEAKPDNYLLGDFHLKCPKCGQVDKVDGGTAQHKCDNCKTQVFVKGKVQMVCPNKHVNEVEVKGEINTYPCKVCRVDCCTKRIR
jgi:hypothetical protein